MTARWFGSVVLSGVLVLGGCSGPDGQARHEAEGSMGADGSDAARGAELARRLLILDGHVDVPYRLQSDPEDVGEATERGDFDYPRAVEGGLDVPFMSIYIPASYQETGGAREFADGLIDGVEEIAERHPAKFVMVKSVAEARQAFAEGKIGMALGLENGEPIEGDLANLDHFHARGVRYITLTHSKNNHICDSSYDTERTWNGLSPFGKKLIDAMNRVGVMIDVSHVSDDTFYQVMELSRAPVIASHSSCRHFTPGFERNMDDAMIRKLAERGGVIQINFGSSFLSEAYRKQSDEYRAAFKDHLKAQGIPEDSDASRAERDVFLASRPKIPYAGLDDVVAHIDHVVKLVGVDHVGLGSDFDGVGDSLPTGLKDVSDYPNLLGALLDLGYSEEDIEKICSGNVLRVWSEVERLAAAS